MNTLTTPETDSEEIIITKGKPTHWVSKEFARRLERERDEAREQRDRLAEALEKVIRCHHDQPCTAIVLQQDDEIKRLREALQSLTPKP